MKELSLSPPGTLSPNNFTPIVLPNLYRGVWTASQTGNLITVSSPIQGFTAGISTTGVMTVTAINAGTVIENGKNIYGSGFVTYARITGFVSGTNGGVGVYTVGWTPAIAVPAGTSITCAHQHNMPSQADDIALAAANQPTGNLSNYGVKVYLSFPRNPYLTTGFYENIIITSVTSFTCIAENTQSTPTIIPVLTTQGLGIPLHPYRIKIPKNTVTVNSSIRFESLIKFGTHSAYTGENYSVALGRTNIQGVQGGTFFNHNNIAGSGGGNSYHHYSLIKLLGDGNYLCNSFGGPASWGTSRIVNNSTTDFILNDGFDLVPSASMNNENPDRSIVPKEWCINTYQLWTNISVDYVK